MMMPSSPLAVPVVLFGFGEWSKKHWFPVLANLARWGILSLTVVERWQIIPSELSGLAQEGVLDYLAWESCFESEAALSWKVAFVITSANAHAQVIHRLLEKVSSLKVIVCEKPCGESLNQAQAIFGACQRAGITLLIADHYLLRPPVQHLLIDPQPLLSIGELVQITAAINESKPTGPNQGVIADMLVHLLDVLLAFFPGAQFTPVSAYIAQGLSHAHNGHETYAFAIGRLYIPNRLSVPCYLECGKQLAEDRKAVTFMGREGTLHLDLIGNSLSLTRKKTDHGRDARATFSKGVYLKWNPTWSYARLILKSLSLSSPNLVPFHRK